MSDIIIIGVAGGSGSGKTTFVNKLVQNLNDDCLVLAQDDYYHDQSDKFDHDGGAVNFDHPNALDFQLLSQHLQMLKNGESIEVPQYDFATHSRKSESIRLEPKRIIILDGILIFSTPLIVDQLDHKIYIDCHEDLRFERRLKRDTEERGRTPEGVHAQFYSQVKPMHDQFVEPSQIHACDIVDLDNFNAMLKLWTQKLRA